MSPSAMIPRQYLILFFSDARLLTDSYLVSHFDLVHLHHLVSHSSSSFCPRSAGSSAPTGPSGASTSLTSSPTWFTPRACVRWPRPPNSCRPSPSTRRCFCRCVFFGIPRFISSLVFLFCHSLCRCFENFLVQLQIWIVCFSLGICICNYSFQLPANGFETDF